MQITKRDFLKKLGLTAVAGAAGAARADEFVAVRSEKLPPGAIGDPMNPWFGQRIYPLPHTIEDGPSCRMEGGKIVMPAREVPLFHETDVVVVGGGPAGFAAAVAAARTGAKVALVEKDGSLGGLFTNGMVLIMLATGIEREIVGWFGNCGPHNGLALPYRCLLPKKGKTSWRRDVASVRRIRSTRFVSSARASSRDRRPERPPPWRRVTA